MGQVERITERSAKGTYCFEVCEVVGGFLVALVHYQDTPEDEAKEQTVILEELLASWKEATARLREIYQLEKSKGFPGYRLTKPVNLIVRVKDMYKDDYSVAV
jgi:phage terminase large subunit GpA-like protein